jgi:hypothetical protein
MVASSMSVPRDENLEFFDEQIESLETELEEIRPKLLEKIRMRLGIKVNGDRKKNSPKEVPDTKNSVPRNAKKTPASKAGKEPIVAPGNVEATQEVKKPEDMATLEVKKHVYEAPLEDKMGPEDKVPTDIKDEVEFSFLGPSFLGPNFERLSFNLLDSVLQEPTDDPVKDKVPTEVSEEPCDDSQDSSTPETTAATFDAKPLEVNKPDIQDTETPVLETPL